MERILLHYPFTIIKDGQWLRSALLYSDKVSSIVPFHNGMNDARFPSYIKFLYDEGEYLPFLTHDMFYSGKFLEPNVYDFHDDFIEMVSSDSFKLKLTNREAQINYNVIDFGLYRGLPYLINFFEENGYVKGRSTKYEDTLIINEIVGLTYLSGLAKFISNISKDYVIPSTDFDKYESLIFQSTSQVKETFKILIDNCLPSPTTEVPFQKIIDFKKKRRDELLKLRTVLDEAKNTIENAEDGAELKENIIRFKEKIEASVNDIVKASKENSVKFILSSFSNLLKAENPKIFAFLASTGILTTINPTIGVSMGTLSITASLISSYFDYQKEINKSELSYLFFARKEKLI